MKLNKFFLMFAIGLGLFACSENELEGNGPEGAQAEGTTYVGFSLKFNDANTKVSTGTSDGTLEEQNIKDAYVVMTNADGTMVEQVVSLANAKEGTDKNLNDKCYVFQTTAGTHSFYAVVNPDNAPLKGDNIATYFTTPIDLKIDEITKTEDGGYFMMSSENVLTVYVEDGVTEADALAGNANSFEIGVERVAAKITMTCLNPALTDQNGGDAGGTLNSANFVLRNRALKSTRMAVSTPLSLDYKTSGNFELSENAPTAAIKLTGATDKANANPVYSLENIQANYNKGGNITYASLSTVFIPSKVVVCDAVDNGGAGADFKDNSSVATFRVVTKGTLSGAYILDSELTEYKNDNADALPTGVEEVSNPYTNGVCWFGPIWVGENADQTSYAIERNHWYNLNITGITLPGSPVEIEPDPEIPPHPATNVAIMLTVEPWATVDRDINLQ